MTKLQLKLSPIYDIPPPPYHLNCPGTFISTSASTVLYIGDPLDGSFYDNNNRGYKIEIHNVRIDIWPHNPNSASKLALNCKFLR